MSTRIDIPADPGWMDGPGSPSAAGTPGGARDLGVPARWLDASAELTRSLLSGQAVQPYALITQLAAAAAAADFATLAVPYGADQVIVTGVTGELAATMMNQVEALADSLAGQAIRTGQPSLATGARGEPVAAALGAGTGPLIVVPLAAGEQVRGALMLGRLAARPGYTGTDLDLAASFAGNAAMAMELAQARADQISLAQAEDHDRIAGDLHDHVIQELFALGMTLQGHAARTDPATAELVNGYADTLDEIIKKIRTSIFGLCHPGAAPAGLPARVMEIIDEHTAQLGFTAGIRFAGPLDPGPDQALAHDILAVTREALSNCARHAHATAVTIALVRQDGLITLDITDNGRGLGTPARSSGLSSMRRRAERQRRHLPADDPRNWRHPPGLDRPPADTPQAKRTKQGRKSLMLGSDPDVAWPVWPCDQNDGTSRRCRICCTGAPAPARSASSAPSTSICCRRATPAARPGRTSRRGWRTPRPVTTSGRGGS